MMRTTTERPIWASCESSRALMMFQRRLAEDTTIPVDDIARDERVTAAYLYILLRLRWLAPDIATAIVNGRQPPQLNAKKLMRLTAQLPADWSEQRTLLGFC